MSIIYRLNDDAIRGSYFYTRYLADIRIEGEVRGRSIVIREYDPQGRQTGLFEGAFASKDPRGNFGGAPLDREVIIGKWTRGDGSGTMPFYLSLEHHSPGVPGKFSHRYAVAGFESERAADAFMQRAHNAIIAGRQDDFASMISFPIYVKVGDRRLLVRSRGEFLRHYSQIFTPGFRRKVKAAVPFHMFANCRGVMLGDGELWIAPVAVDLSEQEPEKDLVTRITAINNS